MAVKEVTLVNFILGMVFGVFAVFLGMWVQDNKLTEYKPGDCIQRDGKFGSVYKVLDYDPKQEEYLVVLVKDALDATCYLCNRYNITLSFNRKYIKTSCP
jgi:hypothetical protein